ncbi:MAG: hypothetical protein GOVbin1629_10 [Prokaryotic dsDNA virus sp.]|nr:MAG: hypothetical protein GOVbin1629_10 [Prokaryotic dsDNA virus sp.]|tara:strand:+ start:96 stop:317 length:222 start_codon:yes stop_codon:yes gene_type:complete
MELTKKLYEEFMNELEENDGNQFYDNLCDMLEEVFEEEEDWIKYLKEYLKDREDFSWATIEFEIKKMHDEKHK